MYEYHAVGSSVILGNDLLSKTISFVNQKGGVGKTSVSISVAVALSLIEKRVLLIDFDPQGNASTALGIKKNDVRSIYDLLLGRVAFEDVAKPLYDNIKVIVANTELVGAEVELVNYRGREQFLRKALRNHKEDFDFIIIDCPPSLGLLTLNAMVASEAIIIPMLCEFLSVEGLIQTLRTVEKIKKIYNDKLKIEGIIFNQFEPIPEKRHIIAKVKASLRGSIRTFTIARDSGICVAPSHEKTGLFFNPWTAASKQIHEIAIFLSSL